MLYLVKYLNRFCFFFLACASKQCHQWCIIFLEGCSLYLNGFIGHSYQFVTVFRIQEVEDCFFNQICSVERAFGYNSSYYNEKRFKVILTFRENLRLMQEHEPKIIHVSHSSLARNNFKHVQFGTVISPGQNNDLVSSQLLCLFPSIITFKTNKT